MASTTDDGFHEIQLNGKQLVFLFMAVTVVSVVIFLCGVLVGRGVTAEAAPADQMAAASAPATDVPPPPDVAPPAVGESGAPATASENLSYTERLEAAPGADERLEAASAPPAAAEEPAATAAAPAPAAPAPAPAPPAAEAGGEPAGAGFAIQVAALSERSEADRIAARLTGKGYPAYVLAPAPGTPAVFRVRVGKYTERREADSVAARLQKEEQFKPWIVR
ncbi:MAG: SPOR domain-containing protein [Vicinamibacterales bacterium]